MGKIKDLPTLERPREKAFHYGIETLNNYELLALIIGSGSPGFSALDIAYAMISDSHGLFSLINKPLTDLVNYRGIGKEKAVKIIASFELAKRFPNLKKDEEIVIENSSDLFKRYYPMLSFSHQEHLYLVILDKKKRIIHEVNLYKGTKTAVNVSNMEIIQQIIVHSGYYFYLIHNHPSGNASPSEEDMFVTTELIRECKKFNVILLDHLIITKEGYFSFLSAKFYES